MRPARIKVSAHETEALYHCTSRVIQGRYLLDDLAKEQVRQFARTLADACGVQLITYAVMDNHLHVLVRIPRHVAVSDDELLRRYGLRRPKPTKYDLAAIEVIRRHLAENNAAGQAWRQAQLALMGDISAYMKLLKQKITAWYNRTHHTYGTLWCGRFESVLIENDADLAEITAIYIDLNPVRAGLVDDPLHYRFCGYAEAVAGNVDAQQGLMHLTGETDWIRAQAMYRLRLFATATAAAPREHKHTISEEQFQRVAAQKGRLDPATLVRSRCRYLTGSMVLGSQAFVAAHLARHRARQGLRRRSPPPLVPSLPGLHCLRPLHRMA